MLLATWLRLDLGEQLVCSLQDSLILVDMLLSKSLFQGCCPNLRIGFVFIEKNTFLKVTSVT